MNEKPYIPPLKEIYKDAEKEIYRRRAKKIEAIDEKYRKITSKEKEKKKMNELDSFYKWGSGGVLSSLGKW